MYRQFIEDLKKWKEKPNRKPLIIEGARQVGKTWIMKEFGKTCFKDVVYINFDANRTMKTLFSEDLDVPRLISGIEVFAEHKIDPKTTLLIFDEVQEVPTALASLKYFQETAPEYYIVCAGSLLGIALHNGTSFPVGKVEFLRLFPLSFQEFLLALGKDSLVNLINSRDFATIKAFSPELSRFLKEYCYIGGMPEVVQTFVQNGDFYEARQVQKRILAAYEQDFSKHAPDDVVPRIRMVWKSIPSQLAKENKKFIYGLLRDGARARDYETAIMWLTDCGLVYQVNRVNAAGIPLKAYEDLRSFKLYVLDVGLLGCMVNLGIKTLLDGNYVFVEFKGAMSEQYAYQQLKIFEGWQIFYYTNDRNDCEVNFILDTGDAIIPLEVKAQTNLQAKSLKMYMEKYNPQIALRSSLADYNQTENLIDIPLYCMETVKEIIK